MAVRRSAKKPQKKDSGLGFIIGLAALLFLVGVLLFNRERIARIAEAARSVDGPAKPVVVAPPQEPAPAAQPAAPQQNTPEKPTPAPTAAPAKPASETATPPAKKPEEPTPAASSPAAAPSAEAPQKTAPATQTPAPAKPAATVPTAAPPAKKPPEKPTVQARDRTLWFVKVSGDGVIERVKEIRSLPVSDSPLADVIGALIGGPSGTSKKKGYSSLIPQGTRLLSATVRGATAYLSFSDQFQFNSFGIEGVAAQLKQVVWTATEFDTVKDVQILIEGRRVDYLGFEGIWIGSPIGRTAL